MQWHDKETGKKMLHGVDKSRMAKNGMILIKFDKSNKEVVRARLPKFASDIEALILLEDWKKAVQDMAIWIYVGRKRYQALVDDFTKVPEYKASEPSIKHIENIMKFIPAATVKRGARQMENLTQTNFTHTNKCQMTRWTLPIQNTQTPIAPHHLHNASPTSMITTEVTTQSSQNEDA